MSLEGNAEKNTLLQKLSGKIRYVPELDETLSHPDKAANAKATGEAIARVEAKADMMVPNVSKNVTYDYSKSRLYAENVQDAIDELDANMKKHLSENKVVANNATMEDTTVGEVLFKATDRTDPGKSRYISVQDNTKAEGFSESLKYVENNNGQFKVATLHHSENKPISSYVGNGSATSRRIETNGIGNAILVWSGSDAVLVTPTCGICAGGSAITKIPHGECHSDNGDFILATTSDYLNKNGQTYYYRVL